MLVLRKKSKMKQKLKVPKTRNPVAKFATRSGSGVHGKSKKAERRAAKIALQKDPP
jgi:hypothetical protein